VANPLHMASAERIARATGAEAGFIGPIGFRGRVYVDHSALALADFVSGANEKDMHFTGTNWDRDVQGMIAADIPQRRRRRSQPFRTWASEDRPGASKSVTSSSLGKKYSEPMKGVVLDESGKGSDAVHGLLRHRSVTRIVAAAIEQNHD